MSTRGWYEIYVVDEEQEQIELALEFYKNGNAIWGNAIWEYVKLEELIAALGGNIPTRLVENLLEHNLGPRADGLGSAFHLGYYLFLLLRAAYDQDDWYLKLQFSHLPERERPDFLLGYKVGLASVLQSYPVHSHEHPVINLAHFSIEVGRLVRTWPEAQRQGSFLSWLQNITMITQEQDVGLLLGGHGPSWNNDYLYRLFIHINQSTPHEQKIAWLGMQLCDRSGNDLISRDFDALDTSGYTQNGKNYIESLREEHKELIESIQDNNVACEDLNTLLETYRFERGLVW